MYKELPGIESPKKCEVLWRFMSFEKFANLLVTESLFFTRADKFDDPFEGFVSKSKMDDYKQLLSRFETESIGPEARGYILRLMEKVRKYVMCSCWYCGEEEPMAMWEKHHMHSSGIAIKTTVNNLRQSLPRNPHFLIGKINYTNNYNLDVPKNLSEIQKIFHIMYSWYFYKRNSFVHEREVRVIVDSDQFITDYYNKPIDIETILKSDAPNICKFGIPYTIDVNTLIDKVIISPYNQDWVTETVRSVVDKYGFNFEVNLSTLLDDPSFEETT